MMVLRAAIIFLFSFSFLSAMQAPTPPKKINNVPRHRQSCCNAWCLKEIGKGILIIAVAIGAIFAQDYGQIHPGCPMECNDVTTRNTSDRSLRLVNRCNAHPKCPEIDHLSYREKQLQNLCKAP